MYKTMKKDIVKIWLLLCLLFVITAIQPQVFAAENIIEFAGGDGTEGNPYKVSSPAELYNVRNHLGAYFIQTTDIDLTAATAEGGAFYNDGSGWSPIGAKEETPFTGNYDGGKHRIIGLKSKQSGKGTTCAGLFGYNSGIIRNIGMDNCVVSSTTTSNAYSYAGGIVGYNNESGSIDCCYNTGAISCSFIYKSSSSFACLYTGGIAGNNSGGIINCYNTGAISNTYTYSATGGIAGENYGSVSSCYNTGTVSASLSYASGICNNSYNGSISNSYCYDAPHLSSSTSTEKLSIDELMQQESYVGFDFESVWEMNADNNYPFPTLQGVSLPEPEEENYFDFDGGTGRLENPYRVKTMYHLNNVRNYADAYFIQTADIDLTAATAEGGAFYNDGSGWLPISSDSKNNPFIGSYDGGGYRIIGLKSEQSDELANSGLFGCNCGSIKNLGMVGGEVSALIGRAGGIAGENVGSISRCYNTSDALSVGFCSGGITGYNHGNISNCYNTGSVSNSRAGGIAGINFGGYISNCYNIGDISSSHSRVSGIVESVNGGSIRSCYYYFAPNLTTGNGDALSMEALKQQESFEKFDFESVWEINADKNNGFPMLRGVLPPDEPLKSAAEISEKSHDAANGRYIVTVTLCNQDKKTAGVTVLVTAYSRGRQIGNAQKSFDMVLEPGAAMTVTLPVETNGNADHLSAFYWNTDTPQPLCNAATAEG